MSKKNLKKLSTSIATVNNCGSIRNYTCDGADVKWKN